MEVRLTYLDVTAMRDMSAAGILARDISASLNIPYDNVKSVLNGRTWNFALPTNVGTDTIISPMCPQLMVDRDGGVFKLSGRRLKQSSTNSGYLRVSVYTDGRKGSMQVHRLVAAAFCPGFNPELCVNHKNGIKTDNRASNLEWVSALENSRHAARLGLSNAKGEANPKARLSNKDVVQIREEISGGAVLCEIARRYGVSPTTIWHIKNGAWKHI